MICPREERLSKKEGISEIKQRKRHKKKRRAIRRNKKRKKESYVFAEIPFCLLAFIVLAHLMCSVAARGSNSHKLKEIKVHIEYRDRNLI